MNSAAQKQCPDCGAVFECGMGADTPCWCSRQFAPVMPVPVAGSDCYCESCLKRHVERVAREKRAPG